MSHELKRILLAEDNANDLELTLAALQAEPPRQRGRRRPRRRRGAGLSVPARGDSPIAPTTCRPSCCSI